jgi:light-regulated signal transduction histidine kinase (bacteriophytochrome)
MFSWILESREQEIEAGYQTTARELHNKLMSSIAPGSTGLESITELLDEFAAIIACDGVGVLIDGNATLNGMTPTREEFTGLARFLNRTASNHAFATNELGKIRHSHLARTPRLPYVFSSRSCTDGHMGWQS